MGIAEWEIQRYDPKHEKLWDEFVMQYSLNGTFLQTRNFLNYHDIGRFEDNSLEIYKRNKLVAVCPACRVKAENQTILYSHKGSTFGGIIFNENINNAKDMTDLLSVFEQYLAQGEINQIVLKQTPELFSTGNPTLLEYLLWKGGYSSYAELNTYVDLEYEKEDVWNKLDKNKKRNIKKCEKENLWFRRLESDEELESFYRLLEINLKKNGVKPIHSLKDILEFHNSRLTNETRFYGVGKGDEILAADMMFIFKQVKVMHSQNPSYDPFVERNFSPVTYLYFKLMEEAQKEGFHKLTWGISTENNGRYLNMGLIRNKESYGSEYFLNRTFYKEIKAKRGFVDSKANNLDEIGW